MNGCNFNPGDFCASGTISGEAQDSFGSLLELTWNGKNPIKLSDNSDLLFLQDNDTVIFRAYNADKNGRLVMGEVSGTIKESLDVAKI